MKIGVDARVISRYPGLGRYCLNILSALTEVDDVNHYVVFTLEPHKLPLNIKDRFEAVRVDYPVLSYQTFYAYSNFINKYNCDLFFATFQVAPLALSCPMVVVVHDMMDLMYPDAFSHHPFHIKYGLKFFFRYAIPRSIKRSDKLIAVSDSTRKDILNYFKISPEKVVTILEGVEGKFAPVDDKLVKDSVKKKYGLPERFILYLGSIKPYKNLSGTLEAFYRLVKNHGMKDVALVIAGLKHFNTDDFQKKVDIMGLSRCVRRIGFISEEDLPVVYTLADVFLFPSIWEGFGLPALEAMACGTPVVTSTTSSLPEVAGDAGIKVNPLDYDEIAFQLKRLLTDSGLRKDMRAMGLERARQMNWRKAAEATLAILNQVYALKSQ